MDENFPVKFIVIGFTGLIGSEVYSKLIKLNHDVTGVNSKIIKLKNGIFVQRGKSLAEDIEGLLDNGIIVINTAWIGAERKNRNDLGHVSMADNEIDLIALLEKTNTRYLSLGSISEFEINEITDSWDSQYAKSKRRLFQYLAENKKDYVWVRIASCFGSNDTRSWLINDLKQGKIQRGVIASNPNNILNLCSVENISNNIVSVITSEYVGEVNFMSKEWYRVGEVIESYFDGKIPEPIIRDRGPFSSSDPNSRLIGGNEFIKFLVEK